MTPSTRCWACDRSGVSDWSEHDSALWHACDIATAVLNGAVAARTPVAAPFPPQISDDEVVLVHGGFELSTYRATAAPVAPATSGSILATGRMGLALTAGAAMARASAQRRRLEAEREAARPRWVVDDVGGLWVSTSGFYLETPRGLLPRAWGSVRSAVLHEPGVVQLHVTSPAGETSWMLRSHWAELLFVLWAIAVHPAHPSLATAAWLPEGFTRRCEVAGYAAWPRGLTQRDG